MAFELIQVVANGVKYEGWESCQIIVSMGEAYSYCQLTTTEIGGLKDPIQPLFDIWNFPPGTPITIVASGQVVWSGLVDLYAPIVDEVQHSITVTGRTWAKDYAESSVKHPTGVFEDMTDIDIVQQIAKGDGGDAGPIAVYAPPDFVPYWSIRQGAFRWQESMRLLQQRGKMLWSSANGNLNITQGAPFKFVEDVGLIEGENILKESARLTDQGWSLVHVIGQAPRGTSQVVFEPEGIASAKGGWHGRYLRIIDQAATTQQLAQIRANWQLNRSIGENLQAVITVPGWRTQINHGQLWEANDDVYVFAPKLKINCILRILKTIMNYDLYNGTTTTLVLVDGRAVGSPVSSQCDSGDIWDILGGGGRR